MMPPRRLARQEQESRDRLRRLCVQGQARFSYFRIHFQFAVVSCRLDRESQLFHLLAELGRFSHRLFSSVQ